MLNFFPTALVALTFCYLTEGLQVNISDGTLEGVAQATIAGNSYFAFYSIPYAEPPIGSLRFQAPVAVQPWNGIKSATTEGNVCYQVYTNSNEENEDCLSLNVFTPKDPAEITQKLPVLFHIHGGGFIGGSGQTRFGVNPGFFMDTGNILLVSINYRLGPFGFLSTGDEVIPGNAGLKDQLLALKWVQKNIEVFGGDPNKVTIFGESAGGASVGYQIISPASKGLFSGAILSSGTSLCPWAYQRNQTEISFKTASFINPQFDTDRNSQNLWNFLQTADAKAIDDASGSYTNWAENGVNGVINGQLQQGFFYAPVVEKFTADSDEAEAFLTDNPYEILASGKFNQVPILIGSCADEGLMNYNQNMQWILSIYDSDHTFLVPQNMHLRNEVVKKFVGDLIKNQYSHNSEMTDNLISGINYFTDQDFVKSLLKHAELQSLYTDVFYYKFSYSGDMGGNKNHFPGTSNVTHTEEGNYIWQRDNPANYAQTDQTVHQRLIKIWTNFIVHHNPTPTADDEDLQNIVWPKIKVGNLQYVDITSELTVKSDPSATYNFWNDLYNYFGERPFDSF